MKRQLVMLVLTLCLFISLPVTAYASGVPTFRADKEDAIPGQCIDYSVYIENNPGIATCVLYLDCDQSVFSFDYEAANEALSSDGFTFGPNGNRGWKVTWWQAVGENNSNGVFFTIPIQVSEEALPGDYEIKLRISSNSTTDENLCPVGFQTISGCVSVLPSALYISTNDLYAKAGDTNEFRINIDHNPGVCSLILDVNCDPSIFLLPYDEEKGTYTTTQGNLSGSGNVLCALNGDSGYRISWTNMTDMTGVGVLCSLPFSIAPDASPGTYQIELTYSQENTFNDKYQEVNVHTENSQIEIVVADISDPTVTITGSSMNIQPNISFLADDRNVNIITAVYSSNGRMLAVNAEMTNKVKALSAITVPLTDSSFTVKVFCIDASRCIPLCTPREVIV